MKAIQIEYDNIFEERCEYAAKAGFEHIAIAFTYTEDTSDNAFDQAPEHIKKILEKYRLKAVQTHAHYYHLLTSSEIIEEDSERKILRAIEVTGKLGIPWCVYHPRAHSTGGYNKELSFEDNSKSISKYIEQAEKYNTGIALENLFDWPGVYMLGSYYQDLAQLCDSFDSKRIGICWDFGHANLMDFKQQDAIKYLGDRIKCTHIHNNFAKGRDLHLTPDNGNIDWFSTMKALCEIGYSGPLTLETHCLYQDDILLKDFIKHNYNCLEFLQRLMK